MNLQELQGWVKDAFGDRAHEIPVEYGVARLLTQAGQLGEAVMHGGDVGKELADVMFVLAGLANKTDVDLQAAVDEHIGHRTPAQIMAALDQR